MIRELRHVGGKGMGMGMLVGGGMRGEDCTFYLVPAVERVSLVLISLHKIDPQELLGSVSKTYITN